jgi:2-aminoethylphosphonate-pyruvate transaminase
MVKKTSTINEFVKERNNSKILFTAGPASLLKENIIGLRPCFGRTDKDYDKVEKRVLTKIKKISGQKEIARMQGSASLAIEIMSLNFLYGHVLVISTGYYSDRILWLTKSAKSRNEEITKISVVNWKNLDDVTGNYDWVFACSTETSCGLKLPIKLLSKICKKLKAKLMLDAAASIGLEPDHDLADTMAFSSCKGLFGLTGASFICFNVKPQIKVDSFYLDINSHLKKMMTGPYHAISSLDETLTKHSDLRLSVITNKNAFQKKMLNFLTVPVKYQPLLCTHVRCKVTGKNKNVILYKPRNDIGGSVVCHLGEAHLGKQAKGKILKNLNIST